MSITLSALSFSTPSIKKTHKTSLSVPLIACPRNQIIEFPSSLTRIKPFKLRHTNNYSGFFATTFEFQLNRKSGCFAKAENVEDDEYDDSVEDDEYDDSVEDDEYDDSVEDDEYDDPLERSTPERFRHLTKPVPPEPARWPWFIALAVILYTWRTVLWELSNWTKVFPPVFPFIVDSLKLALAFVYTCFIGNQITAVIRFIESTFYSIRAVYSGIVAYAPVQELTIVIILASCVLAIAEAAVPDSVNSQPYLLTSAGIMGFAAVRGYISELVFWFLLVGLFAFARFIRKRDYVSSALPVAAVLAAVGEPWVRFVVMVSYVALAVLHHSKTPLDKSEGETTGAIRKVPIPLQCAALAIGVRIAAKWAGYRHLTWMIV